MPLTKHAVEIFCRLVKSTGVMSDIQRVSFMGKNDTDTAFNAVNAGLCFNTIDNQYLVVWQGDNITHLAFEAVAQLVDGATGRRIGENFQVSDMGIDPTSISFRAFRPVCTHNPVDNNYLVAWYGDTDRVGDNGVLNVYGQILDASGRSIFRPSFPISQMGDSVFDRRYDGVHPKVAYNPDVNEFLVAFEGDVPPGDDANEVYVQRLDGTHGGLVGPRKQVSHTGVNPTDASYTVQKATPLYVAEEGKYVVVWGADFEGSQNAFEVNAAWLAANGDLIFENFCAGPFSSDSSTAATGITVIVVILLVLIAAAIAAFAFFKHRANKQQTVEEPLSRREESTTTKTGPPGSRKIKVSRKRRSHKPRRPPIKETDRECLLQDNYSDSYVSYSTYTYEWDDEVS